MLVVYICSGSEQLILLFTFALVKAQIWQLSSEFACMSNFLAEELLAGQAGYALATFQTCLDHVHSLNLA